MNHEATHYDRDCLRRLLEDSLPEPLASEAAEHVADCVECRRQLESLAGDPEWWLRACSGVKAILADPGAYVSNGGDIPAGIGPASSAGYGDSFATDFAVDFLEPSEGRALLGRLGEYEILEAIGRGGMGIVLKGYQRELNRYVAVKVLAPHLAQSAAARGLAFYDRFAFVGLSKIRETATFGGMPIADRRQELKCGVGVVDLTTGRLIAHLEFMTGVDEIFDVQVVQGARCPALSGPYPNQPAQIPCRTWRAVIKREADQTADSARSLSIRRMCR